MNMYRRLSLPDYIVYGLLALGILSRFMHNPAPFVIPILVFGIIFLLYTFPPDRFRKKGSVHVRNSGAASRKREQERQRRKSNFRVIYGTKPENEDDPPPYH